MPNYTPNYNLKKPLGTESYSVEDQNGNMDKIDIELKNVNDKADGKIGHSLATAVNDFLVASGAGVFVKKTLAEVKSILGLGSAAYTASTDYAPASHLADIASTAAGKGASMIGVQDANNRFTGANVEAVLNELFTFANDGKTNIAGVIGSPALSSDSFDTLKNYIQVDKNTLATNLTNKGQTSTGTETLAVLVAKVANVNTGKRWAKVTVPAFTMSSSTYSYTISGLAFTPSIVIYDGHASLNNLAHTWACFKNLPYHDSYATFLAGTSASPLYFMGVSAWNTNGVVLDFYRSATAQIGVTTECWLFE